jgi:regulator of G-protein signaling
MLFWLAVEELRKEHAKEVIADKVRLIYEDFISILSPREVSLDARVKESIMRGLECPTTQIFDEAQLQTYTLMKRDSYPRFLNSRTYRDLLPPLSSSVIA